ncbi:hypothetical protein CXG81DRAFT_14884 [Caulochytrium protostelioides]|uniref:NEDD8-activating enzyme E1 catalytic subunit n=1 Tax=Caulochytrium protostelioides TaxID=1555241 RepID=A0A4P9X286_9FUNG|nr:hypothetical protein CXG81DRAFT_14884 [Caulochytrium protostelioides]|eukprot:RKO99168.1 hypothetical protein CXG81DRAFT_14884 [Caulochytrium protostelioides]
MDADNDADRDADSGDDDDDDDSDSDSDAEARWSDLWRAVGTSGPLAAPGFDPAAAVAQLRATRVLVIGAGGLGCELLKDLALSGFRRLDVVDMDTIDISNLNRQFLFRAADVGAPKATTAARWVARRVRGCRITPHVARIQALPDAFYAQFGLIVCGLDSVEARRWISFLVLRLYAEQDLMIPLIDGGTEGLKGQSRVILPHLTACYECSLDMQTKAVTYPICTIANTPRLPEHCVEWASVMAWPKAFPGTPLDADDPTHLAWLYDAAAARARDHHIRGVTYKLTQGVVKHIIPAIASTNAAVAASCVNEALKIVTAAYRYLNNYMLYAGDRGVYTYTFALARTPACPACGSARLEMAVHPDRSLAAFLADLADAPSIQLARPSVRTATASLYMHAPPALEAATRANLARPLRDLVASGDTLTVTDASLPISLQIRLCLDPTQDPPEASAEPEARG